MPAGPEVALPPVRRGRWRGALVVSAGLHAAAAVALASVQDRAAGQAPGPLPQAVTVSLLTPADLLPDTPPPVPGASPEPPAPVAPSDAPAPTPPGPEAAPAPAGAAAPLLTALAEEAAPAAPDLLPPPDLTLTDPLPRPRPRPEAPTPVAQADREPAEPAAKPAGKPLAQPAEKAAEPTAGTASEKPAAAKPAASAGAEPAKSSGAGRTAGPSKSEIADLRAEWGGQVRSRIERNKAYPAAARGASGTVKVRLTVARSGKLVSVALAASSGDAALDAAALKAVRAAGKFPAAPETLAEPTYSFTLPMRFQP